MNEKTKGIVLGATIMVVLAIAAGVALAANFAMSDEQITRMYEKRAQLITENLSGTEFRTQMREYAETIGINNTCSGFVDKNGDGICDIMGCPMHVNDTTLCKGPDGAGGCPFAKEGGCGGYNGVGGCPFAKEGGCGCQRQGAVGADDSIGDGGCPFHNAENTGHQGCPFHNR